MVLSAGTAAFTASGKSAGDFASSSTAAAFAAGRTAVFSATRSSKEREVEGSPVRPDDADCIAGEWGDAVRDSCRFAATSMFELGRDTKRRKTGRRRAANMASRPTVCQSPAAMTVTASAISPRTNQRSRGENSLSEAAGGATRFSDGGASRGIGFMEARSPAEWPRELKRKPSRTSWYLARCLSISKLLRPELLRWGSEICRVGHK